MFALWGTGALAATTPDPGDYTSLPPGTDLLLFYGQHVEADKIYADKTKVVDKADLRVDVGVLRWLHYAQLGGYQTVSHVILPFGQQKLGLTGDKASGVGDLILGESMWFISEPKTGEYLGASAFVTAPTGDDKRQGFALSDDRWAGEFQVGYIRPLAPKWTLDLIGQTEVYQDRRDTGASKDPLYRAFAHLRYHWSEATHVALSYRYATGAKEKLDGATLSTGKDDSTVAVTWASFFTNTFQLQAQYAQDVKVKNGPKTDALTVRALFIY